MIGSDGFVGLTPSQPSVSTGIVGQVKVGNNWGEVVKAQRAEAVVGLLGSAVSLLPTS